ncbi:MAG: hypothetical protein IBJ12_10090 [Sphingomonadaceae bacterium]|nr:hypothetical protein [Sphingomonadaceae bacterium]
MHRFILTAALLAGASTAAQAATCEETFAKKGNAVTGLRFTASVRVANMPPASAVGQLNGIVAAKGYDIMADEAEFGSMLIEQPMTGKARAFPIQITATNEAKVGTVVMDAKLRAGMMVKEADAMTEMCGMLNQLKGGKAGLALAAKGKNAQTVQAAPVAMSALAFSHQVSKDTERNPAGVLTRYKGKSYTIDGTVDYVTKDGDKFRIGYDVPDPWEEVIRLPNTAPFKTDIVCYMAPGQAAYSLQLKPRKSIKLTGIVEDFDEYKHVIWLKDCRPATR